VSTRKEGGRGGGRVSGDVGGKPCLFFSMWEGEERGSGNLYLRQGEHNWPLRRRREREGLEELHPLNQEKKGELFWSLKGERKRANLAWNTGGKKAGGLPRGTSKETHDRLDMVPGKKRERSRLVWGERRGGAPPRLSGKKGRKRREGQKRRGQAMRGGSHAILRGGERQPVEQLGNQVMDFSEGGREGREGSTAVLFSIEKGGGNGYASIKSLLYRGKGGTLISIPSLREKGEKRYR